MGRLASFRWSAPSPQPRRGAMLVRNRFGTKPFQSALRSVNRPVLVSTPPRSWPLQTRAATAAADRDEPSVSSFLRKVALGHYSPPVKSPGSHPKWHRSQLENDIARLHGLEAPYPIPLEDIRRLI